MEIEELLNILRRISILFTKFVSNLHWRLLFLIILSLSVIVFLTRSSAIGKSTFTLRQGSGTGDRSYKLRTSGWKDALDKSKIAVCLVGGARRFELTGPSIVRRLLKKYRNADLFLHSPLDRDAYKFSLLKSAPNLAAVRIFEPKPLPETPEQVRVLTGANSPNGIQGLLQYFSLVEGCVSMINIHQRSKNFTYDWIVRTRVDGYWAAPLGPDNFVPGKYVVPTGSAYGGLNDRFGIGEFNTSTVALSRLSLISHLESAGLRRLNSEMSFKAQLTTQGVPYKTAPVHFCIVSDRKYAFPPGRLGVPVASLASEGTLSGAKCRPCTPACRGRCVGRVMEGLQRDWSWVDWRNQSVQLCDARNEWEDNWEMTFDRTAGKQLASARRRVLALKFETCVRDFEEMKRRTASWEAPDPTRICSLGLH